MPTQAVRADPLARADTTAPVRSGVVTPRRFKRDLAAITLAAWVFRVVFVVVARGNDAPTGDGIVFNRQAKLLLEGELFVQPAMLETWGVSWPTAIKAPLYTIYLALWSAVGADTFLANRLATTFLGAATVAVCGWVGYRIAGPRAGLLAAGLAAVNPSLWILDGAVHTESMYALCLALVIWASYSLWERRVPKQAVLFGGAIGLASLARFEGVLLLGLIGIPLVFGMRNRAPLERVALWVVSAGTAVALLVPWVAFNLARFEEPVFLSPSPGTVLMSANCDATYEGSLLGYHSLGCLPPEVRVYFGDPSGLDPACACAAGDWACVEACLAGDESVLFSAWADDGLQYIRDHQDRVPIVVAARVGRVWNVYAPAQGVDLDTVIELRGRTPSWLGVAVFWALLPLAVVGLVDLRKRRLPISPLVAMALSATLIAATSMGITRYRVALDVALVIAGAVGIDRLWRHLRPAPSGSDDSARPGGGVPAAEAGEAVSR